jgi:hypothetical protein
MIINLWLAGIRNKTLAHWRQNEKAEKPAGGLLSAGSDAPTLQNLFSFTKFISRVLVDVTVCENLHSIGQQRT